MYTHINSWSFSCTCTRCRSTAAPWPWPAHGHTASPCEAAAPPLQPSAPPRTGKTGPTTSCCNGKFNCSESFKFLLKFYPYSLTMKKIVEIRMRAYQFKNTLCSNERLKIYANFSLTHLYIVYPGCSGTDHIR